jgi:hypothetical protein
MRHRGPLAADQNLFVNHILRGMWGNHDAVAGEQGCEPFNHRIDTAVGVALLLVQGVFADGAYLGLDRQHGGVDLASRPVLGL